MTPAIAWLVVALLVALILIPLLRWVSNGSRTAEKDTSFIRSWVAVALVGGLLVFALMSFFIDDPTLRSLLMGGVVASAGTAVAFYFSTKHSEASQQALLTAAFGTPTRLVPDLVGQTIDKAKGILASLDIPVQVPDGTAGTATVTKTSPGARQRVKAGEAVTLDVT